MDNPIKCEKCGKIIAKLVMDRNTRIESVTFVNGHSVSFTSTLGELLDEINHYQAFYLSNIGSYTTSTISVSTNNRVNINPRNLTYEMRCWLSNRMK